MKLAVSKLIRAAGILCVGLLAGASTVSDLRAQQGSSSGAAGSDLLQGEVRNGAEPVSGVPVTLHRVSAGTSGPVAQMDTDAAGRFEFRLPPPDTVGFTVYFTTAEYQSVKYFGRALHPDEEAGAYTLEVFDTTSTLGEAIRVSRRDLVLISQPDGGWEVDELIRVHNPADKTLVGTGGMPAWEFHIPAEAEAFEVGDNGIPAQQITRMEDRVLVSVPLVPGDREILFRYHLPATASQAAFTLKSAADTFNLFVRQPSPELEVVGLSSTEMVTVQNERFLQYSGTDFAPGEEVKLEWKSGAPPVDPILTGVVLTVLLLSVGAWAAVRNRRPVPVPARAS